MTASIVAAIIAVYVAFQMFRKSIWWVDTIAILILGYICGRGDTAIGGALNACVRAITTSVNFIAGLFA